MLISVAVPVILLMTLAVVVTRGVERFVPESIPGLALSVVLTATLMWWISALGFFILYLWQSTAVLDLLSINPSSGLRYFLMLGLKSGLIWGPLVLITVSTAPRRWKVARW